MFFILDKSIPSSVANILTIHISLTYQTFQQKQVLTTILWVCIETHLLHTKLFNTETAL